MSAFCSGSLRSQMSWLVLRANGAVLIVPNATLTHLLLQTVSPIYIYLR